MDEISFLLKEYTICVTVRCQSNKWPKVVESILRAWNCIDAESQMDALSSHFQISMSFFKTQTGMLRSSAEAVRMQKKHPFPAEELLERIPVASSVISGLGHFVLIIWQYQRKKKKEQGKVFQAGLLWPRVSVEKVSFLLRSLTEREWAGILPHGVSLKCEHLGTEDTYKDHFSELREIN